MFLKRGRIALSRGRDFPEMLTFPEQTTNYGAGHFTSKLFRELCIWDLMGSSRST